MIELWGWNWRLKLEELRKLMYHMIFYLDIIVQDQIEWDSWTELNSIMLMANKYGQCYFNVIETDLNLAWNRL